MRTIRIEHPELGNNQLALVIPTLFGNQKILFNGKEVLKSNGTYSITEQIGHKFEITIKNNVIDHIPNILVNEEQIEIERPLKWYEYLWMGLPIVLAFQGGFLGALLGFFALRLNSSLFRSDRNTIQKYLSTLIVNVLVTVVFFVAASFLNDLIKGDQ